MYKVEIRGVTTGGQIYTDTHLLASDEIGEFMQRLLPDLVTTSIFEIRVVWES